MPGLQVVGLSAASMAIVLGAIGYPLVLKDLVQASHYGSDLIPRGNLSFPVRFRITPPGLRSYRSPPQSWNGARVGIPRIRHCFGTDEMRVEIGSPRRPLALPGLFASRVTHSMESSTRQIPPQPSISNARLYRCPPHGHGLVDRNLARANENPHRVGGYTTRTGWK